MENTYSIDRTGFPEFKTWPVSQTPHRCPVCGGRGNVPRGFYDGLETNGSSAGQMTEPCRACGGNGVLWG